MASNDEMTETMAQLQGLMNQAAMTQSVHSAVAAYDAFAGAAMVEVIKMRGEKLSAAAVAEVAWDFADAMMVERKRRGLGGFNSGE